MAHARGIVRGSGRLPIVVLGAAYAVIAPPRATHNRKTACGSCRSRGRQERAHRSLENAQNAFCASSERLARSAGGSPARATARRPVAWIAGRREIEDRKPIDNPIERVGASHRAAAEANADVASKECSPEGPARETGVKAAWERHTLAKVLAHFGGVGGGGTVTRTR